MDANDNEPTKHIIKMDDLLFASVPSKARAEVIEASVTIERTITLMLAMFLDIDIDKSKSFDKNGLSFNAKLLLLSDINLIDKEEKAKLIKFSEIRNIFAHDAKSWTFSYCFEQNDLKAFLLKRYGKQNSTYNFEEDNNALLFRKLFEDVKNTCRKLFNKMMDKAKDIGRQQATNGMFANLRDVLAELSEADPSFGAIIDNAYEVARKRFKEEDNNLS